MNKNVLSTSYITKVAILAAISTLLMFILEFPFPLLPSFLLFDFSEIPVLVGAFTLGPLSVIIIELIKNIFHLIFKNTTMGIGEAANFVVGVAFALPAAIIYAKNRTRKNALVALAVGGVVSVIVAIVSNYYAWIPLYGKLLGFSEDAIVGMSQKDNTSIIDMKTFMALGIAPFNAIKVIIVSSITFLIYKRLSPILRK